MATISALFSSVFRCAKQNMTGQTDGQSAGAYRTHSSGWDGPSHKKGHDSGRA
jgi:hypothetical protein